MTDDLSGQEVPPEDLPSGSEVPPEDLPPEDTSTAMAGQEVPDSDLPDEALQAKYGTAGQQAEAGFEGFARGITGGLSDAAAVGMRKAASALGVPDEDLHYIAPDPEQMEQRKEVNSGESTATELAGNIALMSKLPQVGSKAINGMIQMGLISGGDELSKAMLGQGDPISAVAMHMAASGALGLFGGAIAGKAESLGNSGLKALENSKYGTKLSSFIYGIGHAASFPGQDAVPLASSALTNAERIGVDDSAFKSGQKFFNSYATNLPRNVARVAAPTLGGYLGGWGGAAASTVLEQFLEKAAPQASTKIAPAILKAAASGTVDNLSDIIDHATSLSNGLGAINKGVNSLFNASGNKAVDYVTSDKDREKLDKYLQEGGTDQEIRDEAAKQGVQGFAEGGQVSSLNDSVNPVAQVYPEQNVLLNGAKSRVSGYLSQQRPIKQNTRPYDTQRDDPQKQREYEKTLDMANQPLSILNKIKDGSLVPKHMQAFTAMYPELHSELSKKITEKMADQNLKEEKRPPYHVRQAMSLFLGSSLDSTLTQPVIAAAQATFIQQNNQKAMANSKAAGLVKNAKMGQTPAQGAEARLNKT